MSDEEEASGAGTKKRRSRHCDRIRVAAHQSFTEPEVEALAQLLDLIARGADVRIASRHAALELDGLRRKAASMRRTIARRRADRARILSGAA